MMPTTVATATTTMATTLLTMMTVSNCQNVNSQNPCRQLSSSLYLSIRTHFSQFLFLSSVKLFQEFICSEGKCLGSLMNQKAANKPIPNDQILPKAREFIQQFYGATGKR